MVLLPLAQILPESSLFYAVLTGTGFVLGIYGHAARMPRLVAFSIMLVFVATLLTLVAARTLGGSPGVELP